MYNINGYTIFNARMVLDLSCWAKLSGIIWEKMQISSCTLLSIPSLWGKSVELSSKIPQFDPVGDGQVLFYFLFFLTYKKKKQYL